MSPFAAMHHMFPASSLHAHVYSQCAVHLLFLSSRNHNVSPRPSIPVLFRDYWTSIVDPQMYVTPNESPWLTTILRSASFTPGD